MPNVSPFRRYVVYFYKKTQPAALVLSHLISSLKCINISIIINNLTIDFQFLVIIQNSAIVELFYIRRRNNSMQLSEAYSMRIIELMNERDWSGYKLSGKSAVPNSTVSNILLGKRKSCNLTTALNICRGFNITLENFFASNLFSFENLDDN